MRKRELEKFISDIIYMIVIGVIMSKTTVAVSHETKEMLRKLGEKGESYDSIIRNLIEEVGIEKLDDRWNKILEDDEFLSLEEL